MDTGTTRPLIESSLTGLLNIWEFNNTPIGTSTHPNKEVACYAHEVVANVANFVWFDRVDKAKVMNAGGVGLLSKFYNQSVYNALSSVYPSHKWYPWLFGRAPPNYWDNIEHQRHFLDWALKELGFSKLEDWYSIPSEQVIAKQGSSITFFYGVDVLTLFWLILVLGKGLLNKYGKSMDLMLRTIYPEHKWEGWRHGKSPRGYWQNVRFFIRVQ
jgi:hypothetical protein